MIGIALTAALLIGLGYLTSSRRSAAPRAQPVEILAPADQATVDSPLVVLFVTREPLALHPTGWGTDDLHLHARVAGVEYMPAAAEIVQTDSVFRWTLPSVPRGSHTIQLGWADLRHRELSAGKSRQINVTIR
jgi:hypothetical protein